MEEKLVKVLLAQYKERGVDLYALLDDSFFMKLNLQTKVDLIKQHAAEIIAGTNKGMTKNDIRNIVIDAAMAGAGTGLSATLAAKSVHHYFAPGTAKLPVGVIAGAAALGAAMTAANAYINSRKTISKKDNILKKIQETANNPTDENALGVLVTRNHQFNRPTTSTYKGSTADNLTEAVIYDVPQILMSHMPHHVAAASMDKNYIEPDVVQYAPTYNSDAVGEVYDNTMGQKYNSLDTLKQKLMMTAFGRSN